MTVNSNTIVLRPHHIVCIQHFVGRGYDDEFTANMIRVVDSLARDTEVTVVIGTDTLCSACPNNENGVCSEQERVLNMDRACAKILNVNDGDTVPYGKLVDSITRYIKHESSLPDVCSDCEWVELCLEVRASKSK